MLKDYSYWAYGDVRDASRFERLMGCLIMSFHSLEDGTAWTRKERSPYQQTVHTNPLATCEARACQSFRSLLDFVASPAGYFGNASTVRHTFPCAGLAVTTTRYRGGPGYAELLCHVHLIGRQIDGRVQPSRIPGFCRPLWSRSPTPRDGGFFYSRCARSQLRQKRRQ